MHQTRSMLIHLSLLAVLACLSFQVHARQQGSEGTWLSYYNSSHVSTRFNLAVQYYCVRFTKPTDWPALSIDSVKVVWESSAGKTVKLCFWKNFNSDAVSTWPVDPPQQSDTKTIYVSSGNWNSDKWAVSSLSWSTDKEHFFVGIEQVGATSQLCGDGLAQPENRSYRRYSGKSWEREYGFMSNYCIAVYVSKMAVTEIREDFAAVPNHVILYQNYPNPFNPATTIRFELPRACRAVMKICNMLGQEVAELVNADLAPGVHSVQWNSSAMPSGLYFYRLAADGHVETKSMILLQ